MAKQTTHQRCRQCNCVVDGGNKKYKYFEIIVNNVEDLEVRNVIFWKGARQNCWGSAVF